MNHPLRLFLGLAGALILSSCYYDPYYGSTYSSYGGSYNSYGYAPSSYIIRTSSSRWGYDPYRRCYYDYHNRHYYNPVSYSYYRTPPRRYSSAVYPRGYRHGHGGSLHAPRYDQRKVRGLPPRHSDSRTRDQRSSSSRDRDSRTGTPIIRGVPATSQPGYRTTGYRYDNDARNSGSRDARGSGSTRTYTPTNQRGSQNYRPGSSSRGSGDIERGGSGSTRGSSPGSRRPITTASAPPVQPRATSSNSGNRGGSSARTASAPPPVTRVVRGRTYTGPTNRSRSDDD